jgi:hypothetical protein
VPLYKVQMDSSISTRSPKLYPKAGPLEMADATADLRKSMTTTAAHEIKGMGMRGERAGVLQSAARLAHRTGGQIWALYLVGLVELHVIARAFRTPTLLLLATTCGQQLMLELLLLRHMETTIANLTHCDFYLCARAAPMF